MSSNHQNPPEEALRRILESATTIAVVGASTNLEKPSHRIPAMLKDAGYRIIPVHPKVAEVLGERAYRSLSEVPRPVDIVDVFRPPDETPELARQAVSVGARVLWLQLGIANDEAARIAQEGGLTVVMDLCIGATFKRLGIVRRS